MSAVTDRHKQYDARLSQWRRVRDAIAGQDAVKDASIDETYLPRLSWKQDAKKRYLAYKARALWFGATGRTLKGVSGAVNRKAPIVIVPKEVQSWLEDVTLTDIPFASFQQQVFEEMLAVGRCGVLVEMLDEIVVAETGDIQRPVLVLYQAEEITNWRTRRIGGKTVIEHLVLSETVEEPDEDGFGVKSIDQFRVLELKKADIVEANGAQISQSENFIYTVTIWRKKQNTETQQEEWQVHETHVPRRHGVMLSSIPFILFGSEGLDIREVSIPPLLDLADANFAHYRLDADYRHGMRYTALPTAWASGFRVPEGNTLEIGGDTAWISEEPGAHAGYLEFSGAGLGTIRTALEDLQKMMAVLGARLLEEQKREAEAAETVRLRQAGEESVTVRIAKMAARGLKSVLWIMAWWGTMEDDPEVMVEINTDLIDARLAPADLTALLQVRQSGEMSQQTFLWNLKRGEMLPPERSVEDEQALLNVEGPPPPEQAEE